MFNFGVRDPLENRRETNGNIPRKIHTQNFGYYFRGFTDLLAIHPYIQLSYFLGLKTESFSCTSKEQKDHTSAT